MCFFLSFSSGWLDALINNHFAGAAAGFGGRGTGVCFSTWLAVAHSAVLVIDINSWARHFQIFANFSRSKFNDFPMARDGGNFLHSTIDIDGVIAAFAQKFAAVAFQMPDQIQPFHASASGSR